MDKEQAAADFLDMIRTAWTYEKLTAEEAAKFEDLVRALNSDRYDGHIRGSYKDRFRELHNVYRAFLLGCGYNGTDFRK